jgi:hypothetical protein
MASIETSPTELKQLLKDALVEVLQEQRELFHEVFTEAMEDFALAEAIREGLESKPAGREEIFRTFLLN